MSNYFSLRSIFLCFQCRVWSKYKIISLCGATSKISLKTTRKTIWSRKVKKLSLMRLRSEYACPKYLPFLKIGLRSSVQTNTLSCRLNFKASKSSRLNLMTTMRYSRPTTLETTSLPVHAVNCLTFTWLILIRRPSLPSLVCSLLSRLVGVSWEKTWLLSTRGSMRLEKSWWFHFLRRIKILWFLCSLRMEYFLGMSLLDKSSH